jgi:hypothetical protein
LIVHVIFERPWMNFIHEHSHLVIVYEAHESWYSLLFKDELVNMYENFLDSNKNRCIATHYFYLVISMKHCPIVTSITIMLVIHV